MDVLDEEKSYELPTCSICMEDLADSLSATNCGHVFHTACVMQSLEIRGTCPLCRVRSVKGNLRELNFTVGIRKIEKDRLTFLESLKKADQENYIKLVAKNEEMYQELKNAKNKTQNKEREIANLASIIANKDSLLENKDCLLESQGEIIKNLNKEKREDRAEKQKIITEKDKIELENEKLKREIDGLKGKIDKLEKMNKEFERTKKLSEISADSEDNFLKSLREKGSAQEQAQTFYEFLRIKKGELRKAKEELQKVASDLYRSKEKVKTLESNLHRKQATQIYDKKADMKKEINESSNQFGIENRLNSKWEKNQELNLIKKMTSSISTKENGIENLDLSLLGDEILNSSILGSNDKLNRSKTEDLQLQNNSSRILRTLILPKGVSKINQPSHKSINGFQTQSSPFPVDNLKSKELNTFNLKKMKLNHEEFELKSTIQQKLPSFKNFNH